MRGDVPAVDVDRIVSRVDSLNDTAIILRGFQLAINTWAVSRLFMVIG